MPAPRVPLRARLLIGIGLVVLGAAAVVLLVRYGLHGLVDRLRRRG
jgi:hypothetical protein